MTLLQTLNPTVTFVLMTSNAMATGDQGVNRAIRNQQIRNFCLANTSWWLFDFEDLDAWCGTTNNSYTSNGVVVPLLHSAYVGDDSSCGGHVNALASNVKGNAFWWLLARIAGWDGTTYTPDPCPAGIPGFPITGVFLAAALAVVVIGKKRVFVG